MLGGTKWYLSAFHHTHVLGASASMILLPPDFKNRYCPILLHSLFKPFQFMLNPLSGLLEVPQQFVGCHQII
jgi:hypothetical protein